jgi:hypothetical protein
MTPTQWPPSVLALFVSTLGDDAETVLAFADHVPVNERGHVELAATQADTGRSTPRLIDRPVEGAPCSADHACL